MHLIIEAENVFAVNFEGNFDVALENMYVY
jgi:hypothetical protein